MARRSGRFQAPASSQALHPGLDSRGQAPATPGRAHAGTACSDAPVPVPGLCARCPPASGLSTALFFFPQVWKILPRRAFHPGAFTAVLQVRLCPSPRAPPLGWPCHCTGGRMLPQPRPQIRPSLPVPTPAVPRAPPGTQLRVTVIAHLAAEDTEAPGSHSATFLRAPSPAPPLADGETGCGAKHLLGPGAALCRLAQTTSRPSRGCLPPRYRLPGVTGPVGHRWAHPGPSWRQDPHHVLLRGRGWSGPGAGPAPRSGRLQRRPGSSSRCRPDVILPAGSGGPRTCGCSSWLRRSTS